MPSRDTLKIISTSSSTSYHSSSVGAGDEPVDRYRHHLEDLSHDPDGRRRRRARCPGYPPQGPQPLGSLPLQRHPPFWQTPQ